MSKEQILTEAMSLDPHERDEVAEALWQCIVPGELTATQTSEIHRRIMSLDGGQTQAIPGEEVMRELHKRFQR